MSDLQKIIKSISKLGTKGKYSEAMEILEKELNLLAPEEFAAPKFTSFEESLYYNYLNNKNIDYKESPALDYLYYRIALLIELGDLEQAKKTNVVYSNLSKNNAESYLNYFSIARAENDVSAMEKALDNAYPLIWNHFLYSTFLLDYAWVFAYKKDFTNVKYYLSLSSYYNPSKINFEFINELVYAIKESYDVDIVQTDIEDTLRYFKDKKHFKATMENIEFAKYLYRTCLRLGIDKDTTEKAAENLAYMYREDPMIIAKIDMEEMGNK